VSHLGKLRHHIQVILEAIPINRNGLIVCHYFLNDIMKLRASPSNLKSDKSAPIQSSPIPSNDITLDSVLRGDSGDHDDRGG